MLKIAICARKECGKELRHDLVDDGQGGRISGVSWVVEVSSSRWCESCRQTENRVRRLSFCSIGCLRIACLEGREAEKASDEVLGIDSGD